MKRAGGTFFSGKIMTVSNTFQSTKMISKTIISVPRSATVTVHTCFRPVGTITLEQMLTFAILPFPSWTLDSTQFSRLRLIGQILEELLDNLLVATSRTGHRRGLRCTIRMSLVRSQSFCEAIQDGGAGKKVTIERKLGNKIACLHLRQTVEPLDQCFPT